MKKGKDYELFIEKLYRELEPNSTIKQDDFIWGRDTNTERQIDVSIRNTFLGKEYLTIVQAKDYNRPADLNIVGEFLSVVNDVQANKGILICSKGFSKKAIEYGKNKGIELLTLHGAQDKNWETIVQLKVTKTVHNFQTEASAGLKIADLAGKKVSFVTDVFSYNKVDIIGLKDVVHDYILSRIPWKKIIKKKPLRLDLHKLGLFMYFNDEFRDIDSGFVEIKYINTKEFEFFINPNDYIVEVDHIADSKKIHKFELSYDKFKKIVDPDLSIEFIEKQPIDKSTDIEVIIFKLGDIEPIISFNFKFQGLIHGDFFMKGNEIMVADDRGKRIAEIQNKVLQIEKGI